MGTLLESHAPRKPMGLAELLGRLDTVSNLRRVPFQFECHRIATSPCVGALEQVGHLRQGCPSVTCPRTWLALFELSVTKWRSEFRRDIRDPDGSESAG